MHRLQAATWPDPDGLWYHKSSMEHIQTADDALLAAWATVLGRYCDQWNFAFADLVGRPHAIIAS